MKESIVGEVKGRVRVRVIRENMETVLNVPGVGVQLEPGGLKFCTPRIKKKIELSSS